MFQVRSGPLRSPKAARPCEFKFLDQEAWKMQLATLRTRSGYARYSGILLTGSGAEKSQGMAGAGGGRQTTSTLAYIPTSPMNLPIHAEYAPTYTHI